jgi:hypothetical protein
MSELESLETHSLSVENAAAATKLKIYGAVLMSRMV